ncbi:peptidylprolyl isomerase [uncultured Flavobacterium sp.]|uniref:peptidylprolyl isomerase n=1 Tax=uncultured Flavobacterium sp. TaxID=165435 RepID=UPI0025D8B100|nr:peptidylprolyl isomerase [uncultured Flavobacterium sp.]
MKSIIKNAFLILGFAAFTTANAQQDSVKTAAPKPVSNRLKIDGVIAVVGDYVVLDSDIDISLIELSSQGNSVKDITRCQLLGKLMEDKLFAHQAVQDSIVVKDAEINSMMQERIDAMVEQIGSMDKLLKYYNKSSEEEFRTYFSDILKMNKLTTEMRNKIIDEVEVTPEEVRTFFRKFPKEELPQFGAEIEVAQIVINPEVTKEEKQKVIDRLNEFRNDVLSGNGSFFSKAVLYSKDEGTKSNGGFMRVNRKSPLVKEFKDRAFSLEEGQISEPFETEYGYHIIQVEKIRGQDVDLRHILLIPKISDASLQEAKDEIVGIRNKIINGDISFADAARNSSDEKETRANGGTLMNPKTLDPRFELTKMDPNLYVQVSDLKEGQVSQPVVDEDRLGRKTYKIITVTKRYDAHTADYAQDYLKIKKLAETEKQIKTIGDWTNEKIKETYVKVNGEYRDCTFANNWVKK